MEAGQIRGSEEWNSWSQVSKTIAHRPSLARGLLFLNEAILEQGFMPVPLCTIDGYSPATTAELSGLQQGPYGLQKSKIFTSWLFAETVSDPGLCIEVDPKGLKMKQ